MRRQKTPYEAFARVYDQANHIEVARGFFKAIRGRVRRLDKRAPIMDLGCGTGLVTEMLAEMGRRVIGVDLSADMLAIARTRCHRFGARVRFIRADFCRLDSVRDCGAAVACGDIVNHIQSHRVLGAMFRNARRFLAPGGCFTFETLNRYCFETYWDDQTYYLEGPAGDLVMECRWNSRKETGAARMVAFARNGHKTFVKSETVLNEYLHDEQTIRELLRAAKFSDVRCEPWSPWDDQHLEASHDRTLWWATK